jgi:hypothetical protein
MTGNTIPPLDPELLARRAKVERQTADSAEAQALMDPIFPAMLACSGYLDSLGLVWGEEYELLAQNLVAVLDFASNTFSIKLGAADLPAVDHNGRALLDTLAAAMRAYADFILSRGVIWDPARQELAVTIAYGFDPSCVDITLRGGALDLVFDMDNPWPDIVE